MNCIEREDHARSAVNSDYLYLVVNAARAELVHRYLERHMENWKSGDRMDSDADLDFLHERALLAIQGPEAASVLKQLLPEVDSKALDSLDFMCTMTSAVAGIDMCRITRCGYTGEDGFEISVPARQTIDLAKSLLESPSMKLAGLGARDTLRLEAGLCLYGNELDATTTPAEAGLMWTISRHRRSKADFPGAEIIMSQHQDKSAGRRRIGLKQLERGPALRHGCSVLADADEGGTPVGVVTSGCPSPTLSENIAMAYVENKPEFVKAGAQLAVEIGKGKMARRVNVEVVKMPFVHSRYHHVPASS